MSYLATDSLFPEWKIWTQFLDESTGGLRLDGLEESHPIEVNDHGLLLLFFFNFLLLYPIRAESLLLMLCFSLSIFSFQVDINHAGEIDEIFDAISYRKGASVIRMLETYLGYENFQVGPHFLYLCSYMLYLKEVDLLASLTIQSSSRQVPLLLG